mgnify:CR=1 FL=1
MDKTVVATRKRITFQVRAEPGSEVYVAGDFNDWQPTKKLTNKNNDDIYTGTILLDRQKQYEYKFVINGKWSVDPNCDEWVPNSLGSLNSVLKT